MCYVGRCFYMFDICMWSKWYINICIGEFSFKIFNYIIINRKGFIIGIVKSIE